MNKRWLVRIIIISMVCGAIFFLTKWHEFIFLSINEKTEIVKHWVYILGIWAPLLYIIGFILRPILFFPSTPFAILGGLLFGSLWGTIYVLIGAICSSICEFLLVRYLVGEKTKKILRSKAKVLNNIVTKHGFITVFLIRLIPNVAFDLQNCGMALMPIKFTHYFYGTLLGCFPAAVFYASLGNIAFDRFIIWKIGFVVSLGIFLYALRLLLATNSTKATR